MVTEKMRVHILAKELSVPSKVIIEKCKAEGITTVKNHMSTLSAGLQATILEWFSEGSHETTVETSDRVDLDQVRIKRRKSAAAATPKEKADEAQDREAVDDTTTAVPTETEALEPTVAVTQSPPALEEPATPEVVEPSLEPAAPSAPVDGTSIAAIEETTIFPVEVEPIEMTAQAADAALGEAAAEVPADEDARTPPLDAKPDPIVPAGPQNVPAKAKLQGPRVVRYEAPDRDVLPIRRDPRPARPREAGTAGGPAGPPGPVPVEEKGRRKGRLSPRRGSGPVSDAGKRTGEWRDRDLQERRERLAGATGRRIHRRRSTQTGGGGQQAAAGPRTEATVNEPVRMKEFCAATGLNFMQCFKVLKSEHDILANVNMSLPTETAELLALGFGIELRVVPSKTKLDEIQEEFEARSRNKLEPRSPVVTMLGHVDHGKTSLLDAIRATRVATGEDGGITQHIGASHIKTERGAVTFLDTPGHEAFTAMRARGADLTDVVVLVVAADDGVMPQTAEAINHAKAAGVPIVVALNKIDKGDQNLLKIYGELSERGLTPSGDWGGEVDVIPTSATTGQGIDELVEHLSDLTAVLDLKSDPTLPATGTVIEAETKPGVGAVVRVLVDEGTLRVGAFVVCGPAFGKVRALLDDRGTRIPDAGPAIPVEVWGLDDVPASGDKLYTIDNLQRAKDIASETKQSRIEAARVQSTKVKTLEEMFQRRDSDEVPELNLIIKADVDGSVAALKQTLSQPFTDEVKLTIRHAGVGMVTDSDILLAAACGGIVIAFRVDPSGGVRRMTEQHGVDVRSYRVIYDVCDDIKKALEGLLAPEEHVESRGTAEVRQVFRLSKRGGVIAGSFVTSGTIERSHLSKILRDGVVVREGCKFASLRRFKDDVKEVRAGFECGIRIEGFDDVHVGDVVESYEIVKTARTL